MKYLFKFVCYICGVFDLHVVANSDWMLLSMIIGGLFCLPWFTLMNHIHLLCSLLPVRLWRR